MKYGKLTIILMLLISAMGGLILVAEDGGADSPLAPVTRYVGGGNSTYSTIQDAVDDANEGDTIVIYDGTYDEKQLSITKSNLTIVGNMTSTGVKVNSSITGPDLFINGASNVTLKFINFSHDGQGARVFESDNITFIACVIWSTGGGAGGILVEESEMVLIEGDFDTFTMTKIHTEGDNNPALKVDDSTYVAASLAELETDGDSSDVIACYGDCPYVGAGFAMLSAMGTSSSILYSNGYIDGILAGIMAPAYSNELIEIGSGYVETLDMDVPDTDVTVGPDGIVKVVYERMIAVTDEADNDLEGVEVRVSNEFDGVVYETGHWGGSDPATDSWGETPWIPFLTKVFNGSSTPNYGENTVSLFYSGGDIPVSRGLGNVDANTSDDLEIKMQDFTVPEEAQNVMAETISHERIDLSFEASPAVDIDHYEVWMDSGSGLVWDFNTTIAGTFPYNGLIPDTYYSFEVVAVDDDGLTSASTQVGNTTMPPINGTIEGKVVYEGGFNDGMPADGSIVVIRNATGAEIANGTVNATGMYRFEEVPFDAGYTMTVYPYVYVQDGGTQSGYLVWSWTFDHTMNMMKNISLSFYDYSSDDIHGMITYSGGPMDGMNATNATVILYNETMVEISSMTVGDDGKYLFEDVQFGSNYTLKVIPVDPAEEGGTVSGYMNGSQEFTHDGKTEKDFMLDFYAYTADNIHGIITYTGGPMDGMNATNASVHLMNESMIELANFTVNETGMYLFEDMEFGINYTIRVVPENHVTEGGEQSGYLIHISDLFNHTGMLMLDIEIDYFQYQAPAPTTGSISGMITYKDGDKAGEAIEGATVSIVNSTGGYTNTTTNSTGHYRVVDMPFGPYTITVFPPASDEGEVDVKSGYLAEVFDSFSLDSGDGTVKDYELTYYEYTPPTQHPSVTIKDEDGNGVAGVKVTVTVDGSVYTATTDTDGKATFESFDGANFPSGAKYTAEKEGYDTLEWEGGSVPALKEKDDGGDDDSNLILYIVIAVVVLVILIVLFVLLRGRGDEEGFEG
jgi:hypothetical protein